MGGAAILIAAVITTTPPDVATGVRDVPLDVLISRPAPFEGEAVRTAGIIVMTEGGAVLYPDYGAAGDGAIENSIWLSGEFYWKADPENPDLVNREPVTVEGEFHVGRQGHLGGWTVGLRDVDEVVADPSVPAPGPLWQLGPTHLTLLGIMLLVPLVVALGGWASRLWPIPGQRR